MTPEQQIESLRQRIVQAQADQDALRTIGAEEQYLQAYVITRTLEMQLEERLRQPQR